MGVMVKKKMSKQMREQISKKMSAMWAARKKQGITGRLDAPKKATKSVPSKKKPSKSLKSSNPIAKSVRTPTTPRIAPLDDFRSAQARDRANPTGDVHDELAGTLGTDELEIASATSKAMRLLDHDRASRELDNSLQRFGVAMLIWTAENVVRNAYRSTTNATISLDDLESLKQCAKAARGRG
jgi:hypothetical protein